LFNMMNYRLGYAIGPAGVIHGMELIHAFSSMGIPGLIQRGALPALNQEFEDRHITETIAGLQKARDYAVAKMGSIEDTRVSSPEGTNLILLEISSFGMSSMDFCKYLLNEASVTCAPGVAYHAEGHIRFSLGSPRIEEAIDRIATAISKLSRKKVAKRIVVHA